MTDITKFTTLGGSEDPNLSEILETLKEQDANPENNNNDLTTLTVAGAHSQAEDIIITLQPLPPTQDYTPQIVDIDSMLNGFGSPDQMLAQSLQYTQQQQQPHQPQQQMPYVEIVEQPKVNSLRFRYECEGKGAGALQGKNSSPDHKTYPKIKIHGFRGFATVVVSCVTHNNDPPRTHPHKLVSPASVNNGCKYGICTMKIDPETMEADFQHLGIQCVKRKDIKASLDQRREKKVDPYNQGWSHMESTQNIDLNAVKLCFHVWYDPNGDGKCTKPMRPVCSDIIYDAKAKKELQICDISDTASSVMGDKKIIILCEKVSRDDIQVWFYDNAGWEEKANFKPTDVHKQYAISFFPPKYKDLNIKDKVRVSVELRKSNETERSESMDFYYLPALGSYDKKLKEEVKSEYGDMNGIPVQKLTGARQPPTAIKSNPYSPPMAAASSFSPPHTTAPVYSPPPTAAGPAVSAYSPPTPFTPQQLDKPSTTSTSPYTHVQINQQGNPMLVEKRLPPVSSGGSSSNISLSGIQPSIQANIMTGGSVGAGGGQQQFGDTVNLMQYLPTTPTSVNNGTLVGTMTANRTTADMVDIGQLSQFTDFTQHHDYNVYPDQTNGGGATGVGMMFPPANNMAGANAGGTADQYWNIEIENLSTEITNNLNLQPAAGDPSTNTPAQTQGGDGHNYLQPNIPQLPPTQSSNQPQASAQKGGKRNQKDAGLDSGKIYVPTQNPKANISRQQSSLNTPTCSEQLTDNLISADNIAGGVFNSL
eukprot:TRINITY_DN2243_c0_g1_i1.p1 TRINITY_DN2243_c0_g1~~TRINITY_DN2243_c0_g1_i1.p1  ORF type:complete len:762 (-),score=208.78 TRINITY_DN2243_c0_g1_i1:285-2570(-)